VFGFGVAPQNSPAAQSLTNPALARSSFYGEFPAMDRASCREFSVSSHFSGALMWPQVSFFQWRVYAFSTINKPRRQAKKDA
jgi:hypothetical protein